MAKQRDHQLSSSEDDEDVAMVEQLKAISYKKRWVMVCVLTFLIINSYMQYIFYSAVVRAVQRFFSVPLYKVEFLTITSLICTTVFLTPCVWLVNKTSLRTGCLISALLNSIGPFIRYFGSSSSFNGGYITTLLGQIVSSIGMCFIISMPAEIGSVWFSANQRSLATSISIGGHFIGICFGVVLSTSFIANETNIETIGRGLKSCQIIMATSSFLSFIATYTLFQNKPISPPSKSQAKIDYYDIKPACKEALSMLGRNIYFCLFVIGYGIILGSLFAFWQVTQEVLPTMFPDKEYEIGTLGAVCTIFAFPGVILTGMWLDKTKTYKFSIEVLAVLVVVPCVLFTILLKYSTSLTLIYVACIMFVLFATSFSSTGFVLASEMTYPVAETISSAILYISSQIFGVILSAISSICFYEVKNNMIPSVVLTAAVALAAILVCVGRFEFKRYAEDKSNDSP